MVKPVSHSKIPPRILIKPELDTLLSEFKKTETSPLVFKQKLAEFKALKQIGILIYTDGSKVKNKVINQDVFSARLPNEQTQGN